jgi:predicted dienelactone hydrolase
MIASYCVAIDDIPSAETGQAYLLGAALPSSDPNPPPEPPMNRVALPVLLIASLVAAAAVGVEPPSRPGVDAPELARLGEFAVGVRTVTLVHHDQPDPLALDPQTGAPARHDRSLTVDIWYPATARPGAVAETYAAELDSEPPNPPTAFSVAGLAVRGATPVTGRHPFVVVSHGYGNVTAGLSWLTENLASKGYVVAAIRHEDPRYGDRSQFARPMLRRPLDIGFVARTLQATLGSEGLVDPERTALIGYSMGGYGVLASAGAAMDPAGPAMKIVPGGLLLPYARGGAERDAILVRGLKAVVAISPGGGTWGIWGSDGLQQLAAPLLLISGDSDRTADYTTGARAYFDAASSVERYLLTYKNGGHNLGLAPVPDTMRQRLWDIDWFEDAVWRKDRIVAINLHMITAVLDLYVRGDQTRAAYINGLVPESSAGVWPADRQGRYDAVSPGTDGITVWKGFQRKHAEGLELRHATAQPRPQ